jgi:hypothetical protein
MTHDDVCRHEAGHIVAAIMLGVPALSVQVIPDGRFLGVARSGPKTVGEQIVISLCGLIEWPGPAHLPEWSALRDLHVTDDEEQPTDCEQLAALIREHDISRETYRSMEIAALRLASSKQYARLMVTVTGALDYWPTMDQGLLDRVVATVDELEEKAA